MPEIFKRHRLLRHLFANLMLYADGDGSGGGGPAPTAAPAPAPTQAPTPAPAAKPNPLLDGSLDDVPESFREHVKELRRENASLRARTKQQDEAEAQAKIDEAVKKAVEDQNAKTDARLKEERAASDKRVIAAEVRSQAKLLGIVDLDGLKLADTSALKVDPETGEVAGVTELLEAFKTARPYLFKEPQADSSHSGTPPKPKPAQQFDARKATPEEIAAEAKKLGVKLK